MYLRVTNDPLSSWDGGGAYICKSVLRNNLYVPYMVWSLFVMEGDEGSAFWTRFNRPPSCL